PSFLELREAMRQRASLGKRGGDCESTRPRSLDELAQLRPHTAHYSPVMIAPLSINSSHADCRPERSCFGGCHHIQSRSHPVPPVPAVAAALASSRVGCRASAVGRLCRLSTQPLPPLSLGFLAAIVVFVIVVGPAALASLGVEPLDPLAICSFR